MEKESYSRKDIDTASLVRENAFLFGIKGEDKIDVFEKSLSEGLKHSDSVNEGVNKIVKAAIAAEFGSEILTKKFADNMIRTIAASIMAEKELRKQALLIMGHFSKLDELNA